MKRVRFHPEAEAELVAAGEFYDTQAAGLGLEFVTEILIVAVMHLRRRPGYWKDRV